MISFKQYIREGLGKGNLYNPVRGYLEASEFAFNIRQEPDWCKTIQSPLEIDGDLEFMDSRITSLSPFLRFYGDVTFVRCHYLKKAEGEFRNHLHFYTCGIEEIGDLKGASMSIEDPSIMENDMWIPFTACRLKVATGTYGCNVGFKECPLREIKDLKVLGDVAFYGRDVNIQKITNFEYTGKLTGQQDILDQIHKIQGQEKAGGKGEFDDLF
jgi:hypothetical protein